jgi:hypothetical protein
MLDHGRLQISEPIETLQARFRRIRFQVEGDGPAVGDRRWFEVEREGVSVRLVDQQFDEEESFDRIRAVYPSASGWQVKSMSLREIFVTLAREGRRNGNGSK